VFALFQQHCAPKDTNAMAASDGASSISVAIRVRPFTVCSLLAAAVVQIAHISSRFEKLRNYLTCQKVLSSSVMAHLQELHRLHSDRKAYGRS